MYSLLKKATVFTVCGLVAAMLVTAMPVSAQAFDFKKGGAVGTASVGGTFYVWAAGWSRLVSEKQPQYLAAHPGFQIAVEATNGTIHNIKLMEQGEFLFMLQNPPIVHEALTGQNWAKGQKYTAGRVLFPMYPSYLTAWSPASKNIKTFRDLEGKVFNPATRGGGPDAYYRAIFKSLGLNVKIVNSSFSDLVGEMADGRIDGAGGVGGHPFGPAMESQTNQGINILTFDKADLDKLGKDMQPSGWFVGMRPGGVYASQPDNAPTLMFWNMLMAHKDLPDDIAYGLTKMFFENLEYFNAVYKPTKNTTPADILNVRFPLHPGAAKYYKEVGVNIPDSMIVR